jgi:hypothetical protein
MNFENNSQQKKKEKEKKGVSIWAELPRKLATQPSEVQTPAS